jgi:hypothetical protein
MHLFMFVSAAENCLRIVELMNGGSLDSFMRAEMWIVEDTALGGNSSDLWLFFCYYAELIF